MKQSILLNTDSYKASMFVQYPPNTETVYSYVESRGGKYSETVFFGLQAFLKEYLSERITMADVLEAEQIWTAHGEPFNLEGWKYIVEEHDGYLPIKISAVEEGTVLPTRNVMLTIENTDPKCFWLTTYLETALLRAIWYPTTVATNSREIKKVISKYMRETEGHQEGLEFKLHDFGARGAASNESAMLGGMAHLVNFRGTDTIAGVVAAKRYYHSDMAGFSIPASEHSTITAWGKENEVEAFRNMLNNFAKPGALVACVSDSYDIYNAVESLWGETLKQQIIDSGATLVVRPDSGNPTHVVRNVLDGLNRKFGSTVNRLGFKVLKNVRVIQGDGVNIDSITEILEMMKREGYSADNIAFGMGGALLGAPQRDDQKFAMKASAIKVDGEWRDVYKDPITDPGKTSKRGRLALVYNGGVGGASFKTIPESVVLQKGTKNYLEPVWENGKLLKDITFEEIRKNVEK